MNILILGNGISRLSYDSEIRAFGGQIWGCNGIYEEYGKILSVIAGHESGMRLAIEYREKNNLSYKIMKGLIWSGKIGELSFTCNPKYRQNTGSALIAEALSLGNNIILCGFDFGGRDCFDIGHDTLELSAWVKTMRLIIKDFGKDRITFIGHDHMPFLTSDRPDSFYSESYLKGKPHIEDEKYLSVHGEKDKEESRFNGKFRNEILKNVSKRDIGIKSTGMVIRSGESLEVDGMVAFKYVRYYPNDFEVYPLPKKASGSMIEAEALRMGSITVYNKGKRSWTPKNVQGLEKDLEPGESAEMEEALGRRFVMAYPRDISTTGIPAVSSSDISRREQSCDDREKNFRAWEASLKEREEKVEEREKEAEKQDGELREWDERLKAWCAELEAKEKEIGGVSLIDRLQDADEVLGDKPKGKPGRPRKDEATQ
jgi:hypothetical protein